MKDTLNRLARGEFMPAVPSIEVSKDGLEQALPPDAIREKELKITGSHDYVKGLVYSSNSKVVLEKDSFFGVETVMCYTINTKGLDVGEILAGSFDIVSNAGEFSIPYSFRITDIMIESSIGPIHNLFHFANIAQVSPEEACRIFVRDDFEHIFLKDNMAFGAIYRSLLPGADVKENIEEFLISVRKKQPVTVSIINSEGRECSEDSVRYSDITENYQDTIILHKSTWGYVKLSVICDAPFIEMQSESVSSENFAGSRFELGYIIKKDMLHAGKNYARIRVGSGGAFVERNITIEAFDESKGEGRSASHALELSTAVELTKLYIEFRIHRLNVSEWAEASTGVLDRALAGLPDKTYYKLMQAQIYCIEEREDRAEWLLEQVRDDAMQDTSSLLYCYYLYVNSLYRRDDVYTAEVCRTLKKRYDYDSADWRLLWLLFYLDSDYDKNQSIKLARIKELFHSGCHTPVMYLEACAIINSQPVLLRVFDEFERQVINFGCKYDIITEKTAKHICEIGQNEKSVSKTYLRILYTLYEKYKDDDILTVLCEHLIRSQMRGAQYFKIYETCVLRGLRITRLYEFYMDSIPPGYDSLLPKMVLMYFGYNNQLNAVQKAFLYANIIRKLPEDDAVRLTYAPQMEQFAIEQLKLGQISNDLVTIYKAVWNDAFITNDTATASARLLFAYKLTCFDPDVRYAVVLHKELKDEVRVPVTGGAACVSIYTEGVSIAFEYADGSRKHDTVRYELERLMDMPESLKAVYDAVPDDIFLLIYYYEQGCKYHKAGINTLLLLEQLIANDKVTDGFAAKIQNELVEYYHDRFTGDDFRIRLALLISRKLSDRQSASVIETCISNAMYEQAYDIALSYGTRSVNEKRLYRLCRHMLELDDQTDNAFLTKLCYQAFKGKRYDARILGYLQRKYNGTNASMLALRDACMGFDEDCYELEERLVAQMIFTHSGFERLSGVFACYYERGAAERVVEAYLGYASYEYFIRESCTDEKIFKIIESRIEYGDDVTDLCSLALLRYYAGKDALDEGQSSRARNLLSYFSGKNMIFSFFQKFADKVPLPYKIVDKTVVEYRTNPDNKVTIYYTMGGRGSGDGEYISETMQNTFMGIFTRAFTLFYNDTVQYYITDSGNGRETVSDSVSITCSRINMNSTRGRYEYINDMLASRDSHDIVALNKLMHEYTVEDYVTKQLFNIK